MQQQQQQQAWLQQEGQTCIISGKMLDTWPLATRAVTV